MHAGIDEAMAVRYGGLDRTIITELLRAGDGEACDEAGTS